MKAQQLEVKLSKTKSIVGEPLTLEIQLSGLKKVNELHQLSNLSNTFQHFTIIKTLPLDTFYKKGSIGITQKIVLTSFEEGDWEIPSSKVYLANNTVVESKKIPFSTHLLDVSNKEHFNEIEDIISVNPPKTTYYYYLIWTIVLGLIVLAIVRYIQRKSKFQQIEEQRKTVSIEEIIQQITLLQIQSTTENIKTSIIISELVSICRRFLDNKYGLNQSYKTNIEYKLWIQQQESIAKNSNAFIELLTLSDAANFAQIEPSTEKCKQLINEMNTFLRKINETSSTNHP